MRYKQLNLGWGAEPNAPDPQIIIDFQNRKLILRFYLNPFMYKDVKEDTRAEIIFTDCHMYRLGSTNDEGFYRGQCRFSNSGIKWGEFYQINESDWKESFPNDKVIVNEDLMNDDGLNHFLFYFRDNTFECIARENIYKILNVDSM